jgi:anti-sigma B factor antagonist
MIAGCEARGVEQELGERMVLGCVVNNVGGVVTVVVHGELDLATGSRLARQVIRLFDLPMETLTLDLRAVTFMDSSGLKALDEIRHNAEARHVSLYLAAAARPVTRVLEVTNMDGLFAYR